MSNAKTIKSNSPEPFVEVIKNDPQTPEASVEVIKLSDN